MQYYYLGDLDRAKYYHDRMWRGIYEDKTSHVYSVAKKHLEDKQKLSNKQVIDLESYGAKTKSSRHIIEELGSAGVNISSDNDIDFPSPRTASGI